MHIRVEENKLLCKKSSIKRKMQVCSMMKIKQNQRKKDEFSRASCVKDQKQIKLLAQKKKH